MSDKEKFATQDPKMLAVFAILGSYFTDIVFNHIYGSARTRATSGKSITDEYVRQMHAYVVGVKNDKECYRGVLHGAHQYFGVHINVPVISYGEFVNRVVSQCVPAEFFRDCSDPQKDEIMCSIVCDLVANLAAFATAPDMLRRIIDDRATAPAITTRMLQDAATTSLVTRRTLFHNAFLKKVGQARDQVPVSTLEDMKRAIRRLLKEKADALAEAHALRAQLRDAKTREAKMRKVIELMRLGRDEGPAAAAAYARAPPRDTIAEEDPLERPGKHHVPRRETIAEEASNSDDEDDDDDDDESEESEEESSSEKESRRSRAKRAAHKVQTPAAKSRAARAPPADFFRGASTDLFAGVPAAHAAPAIPSTPPPNAMSSLLNADSNDLGEEEYNDLLSQV
jgi:hypothetical protein